MKATGHLGLDEPFAGLFTQGMVVHETYRANGEWVTPAEVAMVGAGDERRATLKTTGAPVEIGGIEKMSKSKKNTVDPDDIIGSYGADTARWFMLSDSPPERDVIWTEEGVQGAWRFVQRLWRLVGDAAGDRGCAQPAAPAGVQRRGSGAAQGRASRAVARHRRHRAAALQRLRRAHLRIRQRLRRLARQHRDRARRRLPLGRARSRRHSRPPVQSDDAAPRRGMLVGARPHHAGRERALADARAWPADRGHITLPVQINGKKRADVTVPRDADKAEIEQAVLALEAVHRALEGKTPKKVIVVPGRIVNVVA